MQRGIEALANDGQERNIDLTSYSKERATSDSHHLVRGVAERFGRAYQKRFPAKEEAELLLHTYS